MYIYKNTVITCIYTCICKHLELTLAIGRLIIRTEPKNIYRNTFPNTLTPKMAKNHEISVYFSTNAILASCHAPP